MKEKIYEYGTGYPVEVIQSSRLLIAVHAHTINEGFMLIGHGLENLPKVGDKGRIVFERDQRRGHWEYYPDPSKSAPDQVNQSLKQ